MLVIGLNGSPSLEGNTYHLLKVALDELADKGADVLIEEVASIMVKEKDPFCRVCSSPCNKSCFAGTPLEDSFNRLMSADAMVMASPVYFGTVSAQLKAYWDKSRHLRGEKALIGKLGGAISVGGSKFGGQETTVKTMHDMMLIHGMKIVGAGSREFDAGHQGVCGVKPAQEDSYANKRAKVLGLRMFEELSGVYR